MATQNVDEVATEKNNEVTVIEKRKPIPVKVYVEHVITPEEKAAELRNRREYFRYMVSGFVLQMLLGGILVTVGCLATSNAMNETYELFYTGIWHGALYLILAVCIFPFGPKMDARFSTWLVANVGCGWVLLPLLLACYALDMKLLVAPMLCFNSSLPCRVLHLASLGLGFTISVLMALFSTIIGGFYCYVYCIVNEERHFSELQEDSSKEEIMSKSTNEIHEA